MRVEVKKKRRHFCNCAFLFSGGDTNIPKAKLFGMDVNGGLTRKTKLLRNENESPLSHLSRYFGTSHSHKRKSLVIKCEFGFGFECEGKRKSAVTFVTALFFLVDRNIDPPRRTNLIWEGLLIITSLNEQTHVQFSRFEF